MQTLEAKLGHCRHQVGLVGEVTVGRAPRSTPARRATGQGEALGPPLADQVQSASVSAVGGRRGDTGPISRSRAGRQKQSKLAC